MFGQASGAAYKMAEMAAEMEKQKKLARQRGGNLPAGRGRGGKPERPPGRPGFLGGFNKKAQSNWKSQMEARKQVFKNVAVAEDDEASGAGSQNTPKDNTSATWESTSHTSDLSTLKSVKSKNKPTNNHADATLGTLHENAPEAGSKGSDPKRGSLEEEMQALGDSTSQFADLPTFSLNVPIDDDDMTQITMDDSVWGDDSVNLGGAKRLSTMSRDSTDGSVWGDDSINFDGGPRRVSRASTQGSSLSGIFSSEDSVRLSKSQGRVHAVPRIFRRRSNSVGEAAQAKQNANVDNTQLARILRKDVWSQDKDVIQSALERLVAVVQLGSSAQRETIARFGGITSILRVIDTHDDEKVLLPAFTILEVLSDEVQYQATIGELWGIPTICESIARNASKPTIELAGCRTLDAIARCCQDETLAMHGLSIPTEGAISTLGRCLLSYPQDRDIQAHAFCAIGDMCLGRSLETEELISSGAIGAMTVALTKKWTSKYKKDRAIETMCTLMQSLAQDEDECDEEVVGYDEYATTLKGDDDSAEYQDYSMALKDEEDVGDGNAGEDYGVPLNDDDGDDFTEYAMTLKGDDEADEFTEYAMTIKGDTDSESTSA